MLCVCVGDVMDVVIILLGLIMYVFVAIIQQNVNIAAHPTAVPTPSGTFKSMFPACTPLCIGW